MNRSTRQQLVPAVDRAIRMLTRLRAADDGRRISDLARDLDIPKSSAFQIATTLVHHGILECDDDTRRYRIGPALREIASASSHPDLPLMASTYLERLATETRTTALLGLPADDGVVLAARAESPEPLGISAPVGYRLDLRAGAFGKIFAASLSDTDLGLFLRRKLPAFTERAITQPSAYRAEIERVRSKGYAVDVEEYLDGVRAVAAPVFDHTGSTVAAICLVGLSARLQRAQLRAAAERARDAARELSLELGHASGEAAEARR